MIDLSQYELEVLRQGEEFTLHRARSRAGDGQSVLALMTTSAHAAAQSVQRIQHEYSLADVLDPQWSARPLELTSYAGRPVLLLDDFGGEPLDRTLSGSAGAPLALIEFLQLAIQLAHAIGCVHTNGLIHRDIKPSNVLVDDQGRVRLTGFGLASRMQIGRSTLAVPDIIAGTFAYMSPEQTGRVRRAIDSRSDLYSLGVTLYEMLTGKLPFTASDPLEWIHCHVARRPARPAERLSSVPPQLDAIILKLLAKPCEDRYQTASGLEADLRRCLAEWQARGKIERFALAERDQCNRLVIPEKLFGRGSQIRTLVASLEKVAANGRTELVLVSGYSGIGKSSLVHELHRLHVSTRAMFAEGKFDQYKKDSPFSTFVQAFQSLVRQLLGKTEAELASWRKALREALGSDGILIANLVPELEHIVGKQPPVAEITPLESQTRFRQVLGRVVDVFARPEHPLVLFLDDLQWADAATLELLQRLAMAQEPRPLLIIGAYRDNDVGDAHPLKRILDDIRISGNPITHIELSALQIDDLASMLAQTLLADTDRVRPLAGLVSEKTGGNPFFAIQFISALAEEGLFAFDGVGREWRWDLDRVRAKKMTDNVADLMIEKLRRLPQETLRALKYCACLGNTAQLAWITKVLELSPDECHRALWDAVIAGLVLRSNETYTFLHDRVQEAAYALIPVEDRAAVHMQIGRRLADSLGKAQMDDHIFDLVNQFNRGKSIESERAERTFVARLNLHAAQRAKNSGAYGAACVFLREADSRLFPDRWETSYELAFAIALEYAESSFLNRDLTAAADLIATLLERAASKADLAGAYHLKIQWHVVMSDNRQAVASALQCMRLFGMEADEHPQWSTVQREYELVRRNLGERPIEGIVDLPAMRNQEIQAVMRVMAEAIAPAYFVDFNQTALLTCRMTNLSLTYGSSAASIQGYAWFGWLLGPAFGHYDEGHRFSAAACALGSTRGVLLDAARAQMMMALNSARTNPLADSIERCRAACMLGAEAGDLYFACYAYGNEALIRFLRGDNLLKTAEVCEKALEFAATAGYQDGADLIRSTERCVASLRGTTRSLSDVSDATFDQNQFHAQISGDRMCTLRHWYWTRKIMLHVLSGEYEAALASSELARPAGWIRMEHIQNLELPFYSALAVAALINPENHERPQLRTCLAEYFEQLRQWKADAHSFSAQHKYLLVAAEIARLDGRDLEAMHGYEEAIKLSHEQGFIQGEALAYELASTFYLTKGFEITADAYLRNARHRYEQWGALGKVRQLEARYPNLRSQGPALGSPTATMQTAGAQLDAEIVARASQMLSSEIVLPKLIEKLMSLALEYAGAGRGLLILLHGSDPYVEAEATTRDGGVAVRVARVDLASDDYPRSIIQYVLRTRERMACDDAAAQSTNVDDDYVRRRGSKSVLCVPIVKQTQVMGALYLENDLTSHAFTTERVAVLEVLASQAAISIENARLYSDLQLNEVYLKEAQRLSSTGSFYWRVASNEVQFSEQTYRHNEFDPTMPVTLDMIMGRFHPDDVPLGLNVIDQARKAGADIDYEYRMRMPDGSVKYMHLVAPARRDPNGELAYVGAIQDVTQARLAEQALAKARSELAHVSRVSSLGELTASIAHELNQPLTGIITNAGTCLRYLAAKPPNVDEARETLRQLTSDGHRAAKVIKRLRDLFSKRDATTEPVDLNDITREVITLSRNELQGSRIVLRSELEPDIPRVRADRVQLQQVILNLLLNAAEAMNDVRDRAREIVIRTRQENGGYVRFDLQDAGVGVTTETVDKMFEAFYTTKSRGMGMGLSVSRSIIENHRGKIWAAPNDGPGATFSFRLPSVDQD